VLSAQGLSQEAFERVKEVQEMHTDRLLEIKGVEGTAIGFNQNNRPAVKVFVSRWDVAGIPKKLDDVPVQVVVTGKFYALPKPDSPPGQDKKEENEDQIDPTGWFERPVPIGVSTGHPDITAGTIGCRVTDGSNVYALSNNHVYADCNGADGGDYVLQPGRIDGGTSPDDAIGTLYDFERIDFTGDINFIDAAIAKILYDDVTLVGNATPPDGYGTPSGEIRSPEEILEIQVQKYGRTTGLTQGVVTEVNATVNVGYGEDGTALFMKQIVIKGIKGKFSRGGDSGSLIVTDDTECNPVGLLFAGGGNRTIANPIGLVLETLGDNIGYDLTIDGE
jgi:hypothetical protein